MEALHAPPPKGLKTLHQLYEWAGEKSANESIFQNNTFTLTWKNFFGHP